MEAAGTRYIVHPSRSDAFTIYNLADLHLGSANCAESVLQADIAKIAADDHAYWIGGGDYADLIGYKDKKRFDPSTMAPWLKVSDLGKLGTVVMSRVRDMLRPIAGKCLGMGMGNHEAVYALHNEQQNLQTWLCEELGAVNLGYCALFDVIFVRKPKAKQPRLQMAAPAGGGDHFAFRVFFHHGAGFAVTPGGKLNKLIQAMQSFEADVYYLAHVHDRIGHREPTMAANADCTRIEAHERTGVISGSYLKTYEQGTCGYGERNLYRPTSLGAAWVRIRPQTREIEGSI